MKFERSVTCASRAYWPKGCKNICTGGCWFCLSSPHKIIACLCHVGTTDLACLHESELYSKFAMLPSWHFTLKARKWCIKQIVVDHLVCSMWLLRRAISFLDRSNQVIQRKSHMCTLSRHNHCWRGLRTWAGSCYCKLRIQIKIMQYFLQ